MNRPLSKAARASILREMQVALERADDGLNYLGVECEQLLEAEAFWREAVKNGPEFDNESGECLWCWVQRMRVAVDHKPDCPYLLAREG